MSGHLLAQYLVQGLMSGVLYALMALGITFIYSIMKMINWAMGQFYMIGSFAQYLLVVYVFGVDLWYIAVPISALIVFAIGWLIEPLLIKPMFEKDIGRKDEYGTVVTIALFLLLTSLATVIGGPHQRNPGTSLPNVSLGPLPVSGPAFAAFIGALLAIVIFQVINRRTWVGLALRGASQSRVAVQTAGVDVLRLDAIAFGIGVALSAVAGALLAPVYLVYPTNGTIVTTKGFEIIVIGGLGSIPGSLIAGVLLGVVESLGAGLIGSNYQNVYGFVLLILILVLRPQGLFGERARVA
jgi:branched-chain amino acid transport system permease protein